ASARTIGSTRGSKDGFLPSTSTPITYSFMSCVPPASARWTMKRKKRLGRSAGAKIRLVKIFSSCASMGSLEMPLCSIAASPSIRLGFVPSYAGVHLTVPAASTAAWPQTTGFLRYVRYVCRYDTARYSQSLHFQGHRGLPEVLPLLPHFVH